jgi:hypothetical protein
MGFLSSKNQTTVYSGIDVQSTSGSLPTPICWGENMFSPNCLQYENFHSGADKNGKGGATNAVKSFFGSGTKAYYADVIMALCEGPIAGITGIYQTSTVQITLGALGMSLVNGNTVQSPPGYWSIKYPTRALAYPNIAYLWQQNYYLGTSASLGTLNVIVQGIFYGTGTNGHDADPALVINDFLTNSIYGVGFPASSIATETLFGSSGDSSLQTWCKAQSLCFSPILSNRETANAILTRWLQILNVAAVWSSGQLKFIPYAAETISGSAGTYVPNVTALYDLTDDDFEEPITVARVDPYSQYNRISVDVRSRTDNYSSGPIEAWDQAAIDRFDVRVNPNVSGQEICDVGVGRVVAQQMLQRQLCVKRTFKFKLSWELAHLDPMDIVTVTDIYLGLNEQPVRITSIEEDDAGHLSVEAEEFNEGVDTAYLSPVQDRQTSAITSNTASASVSQVVIFEPAAALANGASQIWIGVAGGASNTNYGGCEVFASADGTSYTQVGSISGNSNIGVTTAALAAYGGANPDITNTLSVDLTASGGSLTTTTAANAASGLTQAYVGGEYISFTTATLTAPSVYSLTNLYRGQNGVVSQAIGSGAAYAPVNGNLFKFVPSSAPTVGQTIYFKFAAVNQIGSSPQDLSTCTAYPYTYGGGGIIGPAVQALAIGTSLNLGNASGPISEYDALGSAQSAVSMQISLGGAN